LAEENENQKKPIYRTGGKIDRAEERDKELNSNNENNNNKNTKTEKNKQSRRY
jgi:hypothetical protein